MTRHHRLCLLHLSPVPLCCSSVWVLKTTGDMQWTLQQLLVPGWSPLGRAVCAWPHCLWVQEVLGALRIFSSPQIPKSCQTAASHDRLGGKGIYNLDLRERALSLWAVASQMVEKKVQKVSCSGLLREWKAEKFCKWATLGVELFFVLRNAVQLPGRNPPTSEFHRVLNSWVRWQSGRPDACLCSPTPPLP